VPDVHVHVHVLSSSAPICHCRSHGGGTPETALLCRQAAETLGYKALITPTRHQNGKSALHFALHLAYGASIPAASANISGGVCRNKKKSFASPPEADWTGWGQQLTCYIPTYLTHLGTCTYTCRQGREPVPSWSSRRLRGLVVCLYVNRASPLPLPLPPSRVVCVSLSFLAVNLIVAHTCAASQVPNTMAEKRGFRVVIAGGGVAGLALANALEVCARPDLPQTYRQRLCI